MHETLKYRKIKHPIARKLLIQPRDIRPILQQPHKAPKVVEIQVSPQLRVRLRETAFQILFREIEVQALAHALDLVERQLIVALRVRAAPVAPLPHTLSCFEVPEPAHELLSDGEERAERAVPERKDVGGRGDGMECLVSPVGDVDECEPARLVLRRELELLAVVPRVCA